MARYARWEAVIGIELAKAWLTVRADNTRLPGDLAKSKKIFSAHFARIAASARTAGASITRSLTRVGLAVGAAGLFGVKRFAELERTMASVGAVTGTLAKQGQPVTESFKRLSAAAEKMGATTEFTANQAAGAMEQLGLAGFETDQIIGALPGTLQLASAAGIDIATASSIAAKTMKAFGFEAKDMERINDTLVSTFTRANTDILQLAEALKPVGPIAKTAGISLEDTTAILAKMADAGFQGGLGGTALRMALLRLAAPTKEAKKALAQLGIEAGDTIFEKMQKFEDGLKAAKDETEQLALAAKLFGARSAGAMIAAVSQGTDEVIKFADGLRGAAGVTANLAAAKLNTLTGQFNILKSAIDAVFISTGRQLNPVFRALIKDLQKWINLNADDIANKLAMAMRGAAKFGKDMAKAMRELLPDLIKVGKAFFGMLNPIFSYLREHPKLMAFLLALRLSGLAPLIPLIWNITRALGTGLGFAIGGLITKFGVLKSLGGVAIFAGIALGVSNLIKLMRGLNKETEKEKKFFADIQARIAAGESPEKAASNPTKPSKLSGDKLRKRIQDTREDLAAARERRRNRLKEEAKAIAANKGVGPAAGRLAAGIFGQKTKEQADQERAVAAAEASQEETARLRKELTGLLAKQVIDRAVKQATIKKAALIGFGIAGAGLGLGGRGGGAAAGKPSAVGGASAPAGAIASTPLLEPGRSGFRGFGASIQDALLRTQDDTDKKLLTSSEKQEGIQKQILTAIEGQGVTAGTLT